MPNDVLELDMCQFNAVVDGYSERLLDMQEISVHTGYWSAYFSSRKPKSLKQILEKMHSFRNLPAEGGLQHTQVMPDIERFLERQERFKHGTVKSGGRVRGQRSKV